MKDTFAPLQDMQPPKGRRPVPANCRVEELQVDAGYQRDAANPQSVRLIRAIARDWNWPLCQPLIVARRADQSLFVVDGQHRLAAARLRGDILDLPCVIVDYGSAAEEAEAFVQLNTARRALTPFAIWKAALAGGEAEATELDAVMRKLGLTFVGTADAGRMKPGQLNCVAAVSAIHRKQGTAVVRRILTILTRAFEGAVLDRALTIIKALAQLVASHELDDARLVAVLGASPQDDWSAEVNAFVAANGGGHAAAAQRVLLAAYRAALGAPPAGHEPQAGAKPRPTSQERKPMSFDEQMAAVAKGARLVTKTVIPRSEYDMTLGGVSSGML